MRIGVDGRNLTRPLSGIARMIAQNVAALHERGHRFCLFIPGNLHKEYEALRALENVEVIEVSSHSLLGRQVWGRTTLSKQVYRANLDVFWAPAHRLSHKVSELVPSLLTIHDLVWLTVPHTMQPHRWLGDRLMSPRAMRNAKVIHTVSDTTRTALAERFPWTRKKTQTVYNIIDRSILEKAEGAEPFGIASAYVLFVGTLEPRKNLEVLIEAFVEAFPSSKDDAPKLVLAGQSGWHTKRLDQLLKRHQDRVIVTGRVDDTQLASLYRDCRMVAIPSIYEGFGFPVLEAQMFGKCVVVTADSSLTEIGGDAVVGVRTDCRKALAVGLRQAWAQSESVSTVACAKKNVQAYYVQQLSEKLEDIFMRTKHG